MRSNVGKSSYSPFSFNYCSQQKLFKRRKIKLSAGTKIIFIMHCNLSNSKCHLRNDASYVLLQQNILWWSGIITTSGLRTFFCSFKLKHELISTSVLTGRQMHALWKTKHQCNHFTNAMHLYQSSTVISCWIIYYGMQAKKPCNCISGSNIPHTLHNPMCS